MLACSVDHQKSRTVDNRSKLNAQDVQRIVMVGGSLISGMEQHAIFEWALLRYFAGQKITFRNIGWPGDDVYGLARAQFGSAQNTMSWQPPSAEEGFGSKVLKEQIDEAKPTTLFIGYGSEVAFAKDEDDFRLFTSGYQRLLDDVEGQNIKLILLSPVKMEVTKQGTSDIDEKNDWLKKVSDFIENQARERNHLFIDLYEKLIEDPSQQLFTQNGIALNPEGYQKMAGILLDELNIDKSYKFQIKIDEDGRILAIEDCQIEEWATTVNGTSFYLTADPMMFQGIIHSAAPVAIYVDGRLISNNQDTIASVGIPADSIRQARLLETIKEKNRLHRYHLRPLNEAYIYLFRRHEMGHLAYEMDDLHRLVLEKEKEIEHMVTSGTHLVEIELIKSWSPPRNYREDDVPTFIPEPDIEEELRAFQVADGFLVNLFAADPMIANPINVNWDTKGRAWVATSSTYPHIVPGREPSDKITILEDTDQDGQADKSIVFAQDLLVPHSVMPVPGGAFVTATTELLFLADTNGDDIADERFVIYDGFGNADVHHTIHGLRWMPWGDLHFTQSIYINSFIETPFGSRTLNGSGIWSFRPETERLEVFSRGLVNPWGEALDQWGQIFATDGAGSSGLNYVFPESAHATAVGASRVLPGLNENTPKNSAAEIIYSGHFPDHWQGTVITNDYRANRTVRYQLTPEMSGYRSQEVETFLRSDHRSYRPVDSKIGPDGALYIVDWYNPIIRHGEVDFHHPARDRKHGRIWRITAKGKALLPIRDFTELKDEDLLELLKSPEQFSRTGANRAYVERAGEAEKVIKWTENQKGTALARNRLEGLWLLAALRHYDGNLLRRSLMSDVAQERAAAVRLLAHYGVQSKFLDILKEMINDSHPQVRLETIHALRTLATREAAETMAMTLNHSMDENLEFALDLSLRTLKQTWLPPLLAGEEIFEGSSKHQLFALLTVEDTASMPILYDLVAMPDLDSTMLRRAWLLMAKIGDSKTREAVLQKALQEEDPQLLRAMANAPEEFDSKPESDALLDQLLKHDSMNMRLPALDLAGRWEASSVKESIDTIISNSSELREKTAAYRALWKIGYEDRIIADARKSNTLLARIAANNVWISEDPTAAARNSVDLLSNSESLPHAESIFVAFRRLEDGPTRLIEALSGKNISEEVANVGLQVAQTSGLNLAGLEEALRQAGNIEPLGEMSREERDSLIAESLQMENLSRGGRLFRSKELLCAACHRVGSLGGMIGPDLTSVGSYMTPGAILESILNPNSDIKQNYETVLVTKKDGEIVSGILERKTNNSTLIRQANNQLIEISENDIDRVDVSPASLMPPGLTRNLSRDELRDLLGYLISLGGEN